MPKAYWITSYREIKDPEKLAAYAKLAGPARRSAPNICAAAPRPRPTRPASKSGVVTEWPSVEQAVAAHNGSVITRVRRSLAKAIAAHARPHIRRR